MKNYPITFTLLLTALGINAIISLNFDFIEFFVFSPRSLWNVTVGLLLYQLSHAGMGHLIGNYIFGLPFMLYLEKKIGSRNFLGSYLLCGIVSALLFIVMSPNSIGLIGSSGSIFGMMALACMKFGDTREEQILARCFMGILMLGQIMYALDPPIFSMVAYWGHVGGGLGGLLVSQILPVIHGKKKRNRTR